MPLYRLTVEVLRLWPSILTLQMASCAPTSSLNAPTGAASAAPSTVTTMTTVATTVTSRPPAVCDLPLRMWNAHYIMGRSQKLCTAFVKCLKIIAKNIPDNSSKIVETCIHMKVYYLVHYLSELKKKISPLF